MADAIQSETVVRSVFHIEGMDCADELETIERALKVLPGILDVKADFVSSTLFVRFEKNLTTEERLRQAIESCGFRTSKGPAEKKVSEKKRRIVSLVLSGALLGLGFALSQLKLAGHLSTFLYAGSLILSGYPVARAGFISLRRAKNLEMNFLMTIAAIGACVIGEWAEGTSAMFLFGLALLLERLTMDRARRAVEKLMELAPTTARILLDEEERIAAVEEVRLGQVIRVRPGERIPLDGAVIRGTSAVNQAPVTGESIPVEKNPDDEVYAGTLNGTGLLDIRVTREVANSTIARIVRLVEEAKASKAPSQTFVMKFSRIYTPVVIALAAFVATALPALLGEPFLPFVYRGLVLLVIACPCALVISTPVTVVSALAQAARHGVLIKGGVHLENVGRLEAIVFDKTGTLTQGTPEVSRVIPLGGASEKEILALAAAIEQHSEHHLGRAILEKAKEEKLRIPAIENFQALPGRGARGEIEGQTYFLGNLRLFQELGLSVLKARSLLSSTQVAGKTPVLIGTVSEVLGIIFLSDALRPSSRGGLEELSDMGLQQLVLLTGDSEPTARSVAECLGIREYYAGLLPEDKVSKVRELVSLRKFVAMVGDGVNDAPAMAAATVGIAMGTAGSDTALETADIALMADDLTKLPFAVRLGRKALSVIRQNVVASIAIKGLFFALATLGLATMWMAVAADMGASLGVIINGMRLLLLQPGSPREEKNRESGARTVVDSKQ